MTFPGLEIGTTAFAKTISMDLYKQAPSTEGNGPHYQLPPLVLKSEFYSHQAIFRLLFMSYNSDNMGLYGAKFRGFIGCLETHIDVLSFTT